MSRSSSWSGPFRRALAASVLVVSSAAVLVPSAAEAMVPAPAGSASCSAWTKTTIASGYPTLENLAFDGQGSLLLSADPATGNGALLRLGADGARSTVLSKVNAPGGLVVDGRTLYLNTGNSLVSGAFAKADGTVSKVNLDTGAISTVASGLVMPNGLVRLPGGDFVVSRDLGKGSMTRVSALGAKSPFEATATSTNGMAVDAARGLFYVDSTFNLKTVISAFDLADPAAAPRTIVVPGLGPANSADDLTLGSDGYLYVALNAAGKVIRVDPDSGAQCTIATGIPFVSSVRFGAGPGWDASSLYATSFRGTVTRLTP
ncbi:MAG TPA: SMP-30/gluconolactonase/LRE family protein [Marmoricola sp.]|jgi:hypothetical protein|nr:SMP-30/gluconolactonase/LRE family protein [Marmoricola sp.]